VQRREISQAISRIENRDSRELKKLKQAFSKNSFKRSVCFTGPAGVGKSSLISELALEFVRTQRTLAWLACDPSSRDSGGSVLGDRIRIGGRKMADELFIRSMSTRSSQAFSLAVRDLQIFLESQFDQVWVETAGSGQSQSEVASISGLTVLILQPETGDEIQAMKSGVRELADLFIVNKADLRGADVLSKSLVEMGANPERVIQTSVRNRSGFESVALALSKAQSSVAWTERLKLLHEEHARSLFFEKKIRIIEREFSRSKSRLTKNPYA